MIQCVRCENEASKALEALVIAEQWRRTAIRYGYRDDTDGDAVSAGLAEVDLEDDFYTAEEWRP